jgi:hypothetical protein
MIEFVQLMLLQHEIFQRDGAIEQRVVEVEQDRFNQRSCPSDLDDLRIGGVRGGRVPAGRLPEILLMWVTFGGFAAKGNPQV